MLEQGCSAWEGCQRSFPGGYCPLQGLAPNHSALGSQAPNKTNRLTSGGNCVVSINCIALDATGSATAVVEHKQRASCMPLLPAEGPPFRLPRRSLMFHPKWPLKLQSLFGGRGHPPFDSASGVRTTGIATQSWQRPADGCWMASSRATGGYTEREPSEPT